MAENIAWAEELPLECPPVDAAAPQNDLFYRLVDNVPPSSRDFDSHRKLYPAKKFNISECIARSCSLLSNLEGCADLAKLPTHKHKRIIQLILPPQSGRVKKTGKNQYHFSWWRVENFDPISASIEVTRPASSDQRRNT